MRLRLAHVTMSILMACNAGLACAQPGARSNAGSAVESHPFTNRNGLITLATGVGVNEPGTFVLDTGASPCVVDSTFAAAMGIASVTSPRERQGGAGAFSARVTSAPITLRIGDDNLPCHETLVLDLGGLTGEVGEPISGIICGDFFRGRIVRIDYDRSTVSVFRRGGYDPDSSTKIPIRVDGNRASLTALLSVRGCPQKAPRQLLIDTGSRDFVDDSLLNQSSAGVRAVNPSGLGSGGSASIGTFTEVSIGSHVLRDVPGVVGNVSIVGSGVLSKFNLVFDYDGGWLALEPRSSR